MPSKIFDPTDARLLDLIQRDFPLVSRPFEAIGVELGISPAEAMDRISRLKREHIIRQISAIFDSAALGYTSALVAFKVRPKALDEVAERVSSHAGVSHCYSRDSEYNLWFTITVGPESDLGREIEGLAEAPGVEAFLPLPTIRLFKIGVFFDVTGGNEPNRTIMKSRKLETVANDGALDASDRAAVRALQKDLPVVDAPFAELAEEARMAEDELLARAEAFLASGVMRRFAAVLRHTNAGYRANAMVCWLVEADKIEQAGEALAAHPSVSHCYQRPTSPEWPYPLYTMIHGRTQEDLDRTISELAASSGLREYRVLRTIREYKKSRVSYFEG